MSTDADSDFHDHAASGLRYAGILFSGRGLIFGRAAKAASSSPYSLADVERVQESEQGMERYLSFAEIESSCTRHGSTRRSRVVCRKLQEATRSSSSTTSCSSR